jgi:outer membrane murein-binding lipoprotein Lpp
MFYGILRMPYEMAMEGEISRRSFYSKAQEAATRVENLEAEIERLRGISNKLDGLKGSAYAYQVSTAEQQANIDNLFVQMERQIAARNIDRERRQVQQEYEGEDKRLQDRRKGPR